MFNRFTEKAKKVIVFAKQEARRLNHDSIDSEHLLLGLIADPTVIGSVLLLKLGVDLAKLRADIEAFCVPGKAQLSPGDLPFTPQAKKALVLSAEEARALGHNYIGTEHLLLGLIKQGEGIAFRALSHFGTTLADLQNATKELLGTGLSSEQKTNIDTAAIIEKGKTLLATRDVANLVENLLKRVEELEQRVKKLENS